MVHGLARHMTAPREAHVQALMMLMKYKYLKKETVAVTKRKV
jgi:hypothetical protein